ncbi:MAG: NAD(P)/FAD-dependent oxidoreductase [Epsilonproteobacteria bacterium]|nr:MAG: NAD(P)/FAD-dependent oxidoreductase [Campylobacterota bacterium]
MNQIAIIGGGAAGLMAAITAASSGAVVDLYEQNSKVGKKILASGNGRCNIINTTSSNIDYFGQHSHFVDYALSEMPFATFEKFCRSIGLLLEIKEDGRCYPLSNEAKSVVLAMETYAKELGVTFLTDTPVTALAKNDKHFTVTSNMTEKNYAKVLMTTGSEAAPQLGGNRDGYTFAESFGHTIESTYPSLVQLHIDSNFHHKMAGIKQFSEVTLYLNGKPEERVKGDILFTRYGISGFAILDLSQKASVALMEFQDVRIGINLLPAFERQSLTAQLMKLSQAVPNHSVTIILSGLISSKMVPFLLDTAKINTYTQAGSLNAKTVKKIAHTLQDWRFIINDTHGFKHAEVSGGGISTEQIDEKTMESKLVKGLYFAGEVVDIVGRRGGFNFNFAWASGMLAGKAMPQS